MVEREVVSSVGRSSEQRKGELSRQMGPPPPNVVALTPGMPAQAGGVTGLATPTLIQSAPPPPPEAEKAEQQPQFSAEELDKKIRASAVTRAGMLSGGGQNGTRLDGGGGLDLGNNKIYLERRLQSAWHRTRSEYTDMQLLGKAVVVYFDWYRDGHLVFTGFGRTSGNPALDNEARSTVQNISPFNPIPKEITLDVIHMNATFTY